LIDAKFSPAALEIAVSAHASSAVLWTSDQHFKRIEPLLSEFAIRFPS
jgi:hypothetical protein